MQRDVGKKLANLKLPHLYLTQLEFHIDLWHQKSPGLSYGTICMILGLDGLAQCRLVTDGQADRRLYTRWQQIPC